MGYLGYNGRTAVNGKASSFFLSLISLLQIPSATGRQSRWFQSCRPSPLVLLPPALLPPKTPSSPRGRVGTQHVPNHYSSKIISAAKTLTFPVPAHIWAAKIWWQMLRSPWLSSGPGHLILPIFGLLVCPLPGLNRADGLVRGGEFVCFGSREIPISAGGSQRREGATMGWIQCPTAQVRLSGGAGSLGAAAQPRGSCQDRNTS